MKQNIVIFIGEGGSEKSFFKEFLNVNYTINTYDKKDESFYEINNNFVIFAHPNTKNSGDGAFGRIITYSSINKLIEKFVYNDLPPSQTINDDFNFIYLFLTDKDKKDSEKKLEGVNELIGKYCKNFIGEKKVIWAIKEIETWFLAGLGDNFIEKYPEINSKELKKIYKKINIEEIDDTKGISQNKILNKTSIGGAKMQETVGREFGKYIDIEQAKIKSPSFKKFVEEIENIFGK